VLKEMNFEAPTEIQEKAIPLVVDGKDVIGGAATGSGKTLAFGAGILENVEKGKGVQALVMTPTRELAEQVADSLEQFGKYVKLNIVKVYGGVNINPQIKDIGNAEVVVGTPGRILDHLKRRTMRLDKIKILILDEADRMVDMGFLPDVETIIKECPVPRQTLLFSATITGDIEYISNRYMNRPEYISVESYVDPSLLKQFYYDISFEMKFPLLVHLLKEDKSGLVMVFCNTRRTADFVARNLQRNGINATAIHGGHAQNKRSATLEKFHEEKIDVLVCTDVAARGLDIKNVSHVYNYDIPKTVEEYIHRIGRTARAGSEGQAISLVTNNDYEAFSEIHLQDEFKIERLETPTDLPKIGWETRSGGERRDFGGRSGGRGFSRGGRGFGGKRKEGRAFGIKSFKSNKSGDDGGERRSFGGRSGFSRGRGSGGSFGRGRSFGGRSSGGFNRGRFSKGGFSEGRRDSRDRGRRGFSRGGRGRRY
jgi:ATP-dependent RNA helicase DeaD